MRIAVIGAGNVGGTLGRRWAEKGHHVVFGVRDTSRGAAAVKGGDALPDNASLATPADAAQGADVILLATPWGAAANALASLGDLSGKVIVDATNPIAAGMKLDAGPNGESGAERLQAIAKGATLVKAFNTTGAENMQNPLFNSGRSVMFYAGDDANAKQLVRELVTALDFDAVDAGALVHARYLENFAMLWISLAFGANGAENLGRKFAFSLLKR